MPPNKYLLQGITGNLVFDNTGKFLFEEKSKSNFKNYANIIELSPKDLGTALSHLNNPDNFKAFYEKNIILTKKQIRESYTPDILVSKTITSIDDLEKHINSLTSRLRNWYTLYNPEFESSISNNEKFVELIIKKDRKTLLKEIGVEESSTMGFDMKNEDLSEIKAFASSIHALFEQKSQLESYLKRLLSKLCPNMLEVAGPTIAGRLLERAGSLKNLMEMPASKIQLLGAEKALFRHLVSKSRCPKHGLIFSHPIISSSPQRYHGKAARALADKLSMAAKIDYFQGKYIGDKLREDMEAKVRNFK